ncbi:hypothetical protein EEB18_000530 [Sphingopyxis sp. OPL5]|uniref:hypothetical protein n=1 Tax=Sphingopyxis sp. OPL5 TaxID=2486273 RepID=UPI00164DA37A|nr:hypothetical protein [Sphingopyxis sp. OPL5]QNO27525.1 hypothetical protein EEB18_000530 [Sphingopyxis sp. OPL5]
MHRFVIAAVVGLAGAVPAMAELPASYDAEKVAACVPQTVDEAVACLKSTLSPADFTMLADREASRRFRGHLDEMLRVQWKLRDPETPLVQYMNRHGIYGSAVGAPAIIIGALQADAHGARLNYKAVAAAIQAAPVLPDPGPPPQGTFDGPVGSETLPMSECSEMKLPPGAVLSKCLRLADGTMTALVAMKEDQAMTEVSNGN